ncbi:MAG: hypothetical protein RL330_114 [Actinomycetota bacterium]
MASVAADNLPRADAHIPALDGLRAVAVLSVIGYHFGMPGLGGGFLGVDLFFVLSGFLITRLLVSEHDRTGTISLRGFWSRRVRRLTPAILLVLVTVAVWGTLTLDRFALRTLRDDMLSTLGYMANWRFILADQSYFAAYGEVSPLRHMWSLAIEEQFYLVWPLIVVGVLTVVRGRRAPLIALATAIIAGSTTLMWLLHDADDPSRAYYGTDSRLAQLVVGALLAVVLLRRRTVIPPRGARGRSLVGFIALTAIVAAFFVVEDGDAFMYRGGFLAFSVLVALLLWAVTTSRGSAIDRMLSWRPAVLVGQVSYGLYLWHWPVQIMLSPDATGLEGPLLASLRLVTTFGAAALSYLVIEQPVRRVRGWATSLTGGRAAVAFSVSMAVVLGAVLGTTSRSAPLPEYLDSVTAEVIDSGTPPADGTGQMLQLVLTGDSLAHSLTRAMENQTSNLGITFVSRSLPGCSMTRGLPADGKGVPFEEGLACEVAHEEFIRATATSYPSRAVVWIAAWDAYDRRVDGVHYRVGTDAWRTKMTDLVDETADVLAARGAHLFLVSLAPVALENETDHEDAAFDERVATYNDLLRDYARENPARATFVDLAARVCPDMPSACRAVVEGIRLRPKDGVHFDGPGARWASRIILDVVTARFDWR